MYITNYLEQVTEEAENAEKEEKEREEYPSIYLSTPTSMSSPPPRPFYAFFLRTSISRSCRFQKLHTSFSAQALIIFLFFFPPFFRGEFWKTQTRENFNHRDFAGQTQDSAQGQQSYGSHRKFQFPLDFYP